MITPNTETATQVSQYCAGLGKDPLFVQGAGGNVSWKDGGVLWVKASGTWLAAAAQENIFIPVDLAEMQSRIAAGEFDFTPKALDQQEKRPSIETALHALMPHKFVVHLHEVNTLSLLVRNGARELLERLLPKQFNWGFVEYQKPGAELALAVSDQMRYSSPPDALFLQNHGVVIGGANLHEIDEILSSLTECFRTNPQEFFPDIVLEPTNANFPAPNLNGYRLHDDPDIHLLSQSAALLDRLVQDWALYPDHVVFLGAEPFVCSVEETVCIPTEKPPFLFLRGIGTYQRLDVTLGQEQQLRCYYDVITRQPLGQKLNRLTAANVAQLLNWDAEEYRRQLSKKQGV